MSGSCLLALCRGSWFSWLPLLHLLVILPGWIHLCGFWHGVEVNGWLAGHKCLHLGGQPVKLINYLLIIFMALICTVAELWDWSLLRCNCCGVQGGYLFICFISAHGGRFKSGLGHFFLLTCCSFDSGDCAVNWFLIHHSSFPLWSWGCLFPI